MPEERHEVSMEFMFQRVGMLMIELELVRAQRDEALAALTALQAERAAAAA